MKFSQALMAIAVLTVIIGLSGCNGSFFRNTIVTGDQQPLNIIKVTPAGEDISGEQEIIFHFNRDVVSRKRMKREPGAIPVTITPALNCEWGWKSKRALSCILAYDDKMQKATQYDVIMRPGIRAEDGAVLSDMYRHSFITQRPVVRYRDFRFWRSPNAPVITLTFNQHVTKPSVWDSVYFRLKDDPQTRYPLMVAAEPYDEESPRYVKARDADHSGDAGLEYEYLSNSTDAKDIEARLKWLVTPETEFPLETEVELYVAPGLISASGPLTGAEDRVRLNFQTFPKFEFLGVRCFDKDGEELLITGKNMPPNLSDSDAGSVGDGERQNPPLCNPLNKISVAFSSPVLHTQVQDKLILTPSLLEGQEGHDPWANHAEYSKLNRSHQAGQIYTVNFPDSLIADQTYILQTRTPEMRVSRKGKIDNTGLQDEFGRELLSPIYLEFFTSHQQSDSEMTPQNTVSSIN